MPINPAHPDPLAPPDRVAGQIAALERRLQALERQFAGGSSAAFPVVDALPTPGRAGRAVVLASNKKVYVDDGAAWNPQT
jgi:hypothetical protein